MSKEILDIIREDLKKLPEFMTTLHLVDLGLYPSRQAVHLAIRRKQAPPFMRIGKKIVFPKCSFIEFIIDNMEIKTHDQET
mgnify:CR=1 FL=1|tara:strand:- start:137 stop:379 length:243 start_codon:yes stop_codon:yes gene_type:complete